MKYIARTAGEWRQCPGYAKKILLTEQDLNAADTLTQLIEIAPHTSVAKHYHRRCTEAFHVICGRGRFVIDGRTVALEPGDTRSTARTTMGTRPSPISCSRPTPRRATFIGSTSKRTA
jgi:hypothetical protein